MPQPGWYPDPADPTRLRYWSGSEWTTQLGPASAPPAPPRRGKLWPIVLAAGVVAIGLAVVVAWLARPNPTGLGDPGWTPTRSAWNESETPTPTPASQAPGTLSCSDRMESSGVRPASNPGRLALGSLSLPAPAGWSGPYSEHRLPYGRDGWAYQQPIATETKRSWASSASIGFTTFAGNPSVSEMSKAIADCVSSSAYYSNLTVRVASATTTPTTVSGFEAAQTDLLLRFNEPDLKTKGSRLRIIVTRTSRSTQYFFSAVPMENTEHQAIIDQITQGLVAS